MDKFIKKLAKIKPFKFKSEESVSKNLTGRCNCCLKGYSTKDTNIHTDPS